MACDLEDQLYAVMEGWKSALMNKQETGGCFIAPESSRSRKHVFQAAALQVVFPQFC